MYELDEEGCPKIMHACIREERDNCDVSDVRENRRKIALDMLLRRFEGVLEGGRPQRDQDGEICLLSLTRKKQVVPRTLYTPPDIPILLEPARFV